MIWKIFIDRKALSVVMKEALRYTLVDTLLDFLLDIKIKLGAGQEIVSLPGRHLTLINTRRWMVTAVQLSCSDSDGRMAAGTDGSSPLAASLCQVRQDDISSSNK